MSYEDNHLSISDHIANRVETLELPWISLSVINVDVASFIEGSLSREFVGYVNVIMEAREPVIGIELT